MNYSGKDNLEVMEGAKNYNAYLLSMLQNCIQEKYKVILDFGAGTGYYAKNIKNLFPSKEIIALEPAENFEEYYIDQNIKKVSSIKDCPSVDFVYSFNVLEHIENDIAVLSDLYNVMPQGGKLCLYVPAFPCLYSAMDKRVGHYRRYTKSELVKKVQQVGFVVNTCEYKDFIGWFAALCYKWFCCANGKINSRDLRFYDKFIMPISVFVDKLTRGKILGKNLWLVVHK